VEELVELAVAAPPARSFVGAIEKASAQRGMAVISEIKRRSPSKGDLDPTLDPAVVAVDYELGGATCLSVLTDREFFGGSVEDLRLAREACALPVLRKDFTVSGRDVCDAALVEVHDAVELHRALDAGADVIGVNQRDLRTFEVDHHRALTLGAAIPTEICRVAESGIKGGEDVRRLAEAGYQAVLVGETLVRSGDRRAAVGQLLSSPS
jgi:indole-3-glycerol phosphate synthase